MKCLFKRMGQNQMYESAPVFVLKLGFSYTFTCVAIVSQSLHFPRQANISANSVKSPLNKEKR